MVNPFKKILSLFIIWRVSLFIILSFSLSSLPLRYTDRFLGGGLTNYLKHPELFAWANFDGEHYLSIAIFGYKNSQYVFFPIYPAIISFFSKPFFYNLESSLAASALVGLLISDVSFILGLYLLYKLVSLDFSKKIAFLTILTLALFPTSFYFGSVYTESLFLVLSVGSFYCSRKRHWLLAGILGGMASATRVFGVLLLPAIFFEANKKLDYKKVLALILIPTGLLIYMLYQFIHTGDALSFIHLQSLVGEQRQSNFILLPQVYYRYIRMLLSLNPKDPLYLTVIFELFTGILFFVLPIYGLIKKVRLSYIVYALSGLILTSIQGSFSSTPRYVLVLFPSFIVLSLILAKLPRFIAVMLLIMSTILMFIETALFVRGYWVA